MVLVAGGLFLIWKGVKELRLKAKGVEHEVEEAERFRQVVVPDRRPQPALLRRLDPHRGGDDRRLPGDGGLGGDLGGAHAGLRRLHLRLHHRNPDFEILGLFVLLLIGFVLFLEGGHVADLTVNDSGFPYIPQWIVIFILLLMFSVDFYQNWLERKREGPRGAAATEKMMNDE